MAQAEQSTDLLVRHPSPHAIWVETGN